MRESVSTDNHCEDGKQLMPQQAIAFPQTSQPVTDIETWLEANKGTIFTCPHLPGKPRITKEACQRRVNLAVAIATRAGNESLFDGGGPFGLDTCLDCPHNEGAGGLARA